MRELKNLLVDVLNRKQMGFHGDSQGGENLEEGLQFDHGDDRIKNQMFHNHKIDVREWPIVGKMKQGCPGRCKSRASATADSVVEKYVSRASAKADTVVEKYVNPFVTSVASKVGPWSINEEVENIAEDQILRWARKDLALQLRQYQRYVKWAQYFLLTGMLAAVFTCAILLGIYMRFEFPHTVYMWRTYSFLVCANGVVAMVWFTCMHFRHGHLIADPARGDQTRRGLDSVRCIEPASPRTDSNASRRNLWNSPVDSHRRRDSIDRSASRSVQQPLLPHDALRPPAVEFCLRVREKGSNVDAYRQVKFGPVSMLTDYKVASRRICDKFVRCCNIGDSQNLIIKVLVRMRDKMHISDNDDVRELENGDELEATFADQPSNFCSSQHHAAVGAIGNVREDLHARHQVLPQATTCATGTAPIERLHSFGGNAPGAPPRPPPIDTVPHAPSSNVSGQRRVSFDAAEKN
jgi:hypothetical protein